MSAKAIPLTDKQQLFAVEYMLDLDATKAAIRAGYSEKTAAQIGYQLLQKPSVKEAIAAQLEQRTDRAKFDADALLKRLLEEVTADIADIYADDGSLLPISEWPKIWRTGLVAGIEVEELFKGTGEARVKTGELRKVKLSDRLKRLELIGRHIGVQAFKERIDVDAAKGGALEAFMKRVSGRAIRPKDAGNGTRG